MNHLDDTPQLIRQLNDAIWWWRDRRRMQINATCVPWCWCHELRKDVHAHLDTCWGCGDCDEQVLWPLIEHDRDMMQGALSLAPPDGGELSLARAAAGAVSEV